MKKPQTPALVVKQIEEVAFTKNWDDLDAFLTNGGFEKISYKERERLAQLFFQRGEDLVNQVGDLTEVLEALKFLEAAVKLDPLFVSAWTSLAQSYLTLGLNEEKIDSINRANDLFQHIETILHCQGQKNPVELLWNWGTCLYLLAKDSEEPVDFKNAVDKFKEAQELGLEDPDFFFDYATAIGELGMLIGKQELLLESTTLLEKSIKGKGDHGTAWLQLACAYKILYFLTADVVYFEKADESFLAAARSNVQQTALWLNWGQLLSMEGKTVRNESLLQAAVENLEKAEILSPQDPVVLCTMADVLIHLGWLLDKISLLKDAQERLELVHSLYPDNPECLCLWGHCLLHIGKYFSDPIYINQAIEKFQTGLSNNKNAYIFWHGLATAHFCLGEFTQEADEFEKAAKFSAQAIRLGGDNPGYWNDWGVALMKLGEISGDAHHAAVAVEKFEQAIRQFHRKAAGNPDPDWIYNYGCSLDYLGELEQNPQLYERAISILSHLLEQYPDFHHVRYNLALSLYHLGDVVADAEALEKSIDQFEILIKRETEDDGLLSDLGLVYLTLAELSRDSKEIIKANSAFQKAEHCLTQAIALGGLDANYWLANLYALQENYADAMHFLERARQSDALPSLNELLSNEWFGSLRQTPRFRAFVADLSDED